MASEIEIVSTIAYKRYSFNDILSSVNNSTALFAYQSENTLFEIRTQNGERVDSSASLFENETFYNVFSRDEQKVFSLFISNKVHGSFYTATEKIDDNPQFDLTLLPKLAEEAAIANCSYFVKWSSSGPNHDLLMYFVCLAICDLLNGVVINIYGTKLKAGTFLSEGWKELLAKELQSAPR